MSASTRAYDPELEQAYNPVARLFHWGVAILVVVQLSLAIVLPKILPASAEASLQSWHLSVGSTILLAMVLRLAWRLTHTPPPPPADLPGSLQTLSRATHWAFYAVLILLPVLGWMAASAYGAQVRLMGFIPLPALVGQDKAFAESLGQTHGTVALILLALLAMHVAGAAYHAWVKRDGVVRRMLPR